MKLALVGIGKIARDQHLPAISASSDWELGATVSRSEPAELDGVDWFSNIEDMLVARPDISVISLCLPPVPRYAVAEAALKAGRHVMLEKPPGATLAEVHALESLAKKAGVTLFASWHSREAQAVALAKEWLKDRKVHSGRIIWREDVRKWHPGQDWIFEPGGMGVFDPGINALSILTEILPQPVHLTSAELDFPANRDAPIAARLSLTSNIRADFDFRQEGEQTWDIELSTDGGDLALRMGGNILETNGQAVAGENTIMGEYPALYAHMAKLVTEGKSDVDLSPMVLVADAFTMGRRVTVDPFSF
ncbi:Gfo/Idh/MocA family protein [Falsochrobactrum ovis]|uniref:D-galactose 1-dehydrogenase n=1 Tax=Falsochrobactrum ovis TaxID=1293442 RepID=A0A364JU32_9HYPH|nr:Gfo/Idh/MocA family oxidoreductase [Falsochrobactrum ovis]RAK27800.1 D-galactose 1-dehydrogenase [Falsochrobactrum ovis]